MKIDGACHCGFVTFEADVEPDSAGVCHCTDCQVLAGAPYRFVVRSKPDTFKLRSGEPTKYIKTADSGTKREHGFCPHCGAPIYSTSVGPGAKTHGLRVGTIRQRNQLTPQAQIWTRSRLAWTLHIGDLPGAEGQGQPASNISSL